MSSSHSRSRGVSGTICLTPKRLPAQVLLALVFTAVFTMHPRLQAAGSTVAYNRDIRPILSENCFYCHGQDPNKRKAGLRLDVREVATSKNESGETAIVAGDVAKSALVPRIFSSDLDEQMPPPKSHRVLTAEQKATLRRWIAEGATYQTHWAYVAPVRPPLPKTRKSGWVRNPIDRFVLAKLQANQLQPSPEADRATLIRRLSLDLTGLPPAPEEVDAFLGDKTPDAYEKIVDRLMNSAHYGEQMALPWLDAARYADSNGFQQDGDTFQWLWRDWVVRALNADMPFDEFSIEQLAGDLLPAPTEDQLIATAFNRNHLLNGEGGAIAEEQRFNVLFDRVDTTATTWLGLTMACAQCHDHKYDPITKRDYYSMLALFNNVPETGVPSGSGQYRIAEPWISVETPEQKAKIRALESAIATDKEAEKKAQSSPETLAAYAALEQDLSAALPVKWTLQKPESLAASEGVRLRVLEDQSIDAAGPSPAQGNYTILLAVAPQPVTGLRIETIPSEPQTAAPEADHDTGGNPVLTELRLEVDGRKVKCDAATATYSQTGFPPEGVIDDDPNTGWSFYPETSKPHTLVVQCAETVPAGSRLTLTFQYRSPRHRSPLGRFRIATTAAAGPVGLESLPDDIVNAASKTNRTPEESTRLREYVAKKHPLPGLVALGEKTKAAEKVLSDYRATIPRVMVMSDKHPRQTRILDRGNYLAPLETVSPGTPAFLPPLRPGAQTNRLGFARWLFEQENPLTARVQVNRIWQMLFGAGLVKTPEDFGVQCELPVHQDLLDWLAVEFRESGWSMKHMIRLIVTSATYRQSSRVTRQLLERDPENRLLSRAARFRCSSLVLRDVALDASELLDPQIGGQPVYPYQPEGIWETLAITKERDFTYPASSGPDLYRRSLYTFWRRTVGPANMFDASTRQTCKVRRQITDTPLHALTTLNDPTWTEAARVLAAHAMHACDQPEDQLAFAFRRVLGRKPANDLVLLRRALDRQRAFFKADPQAATAVVTAGAAPKETQLDVADHAALSAVCLAIFNLDESLTRE